MTEKLKAKPLFGLSDIETVKLDFDNTSLQNVKYWANRAMNWFRLRGFIILKSSKDCYHVVFDRPVSWSENMRIVAWVSLQSRNQGLVRWLQMQCIKQSSTLRVSSKGDKTSPRIIFRCGKEGQQIANFIEFRQLIKQIIRKL